uniref:Phosphotransferase domain-containing protein n=1 Tax=uncultured marine thaumarchaeote AD1000_01_A07 TaxID=1455878 RepID=A0A075FGL6_9ARCH|nr:phosphotransferase domain-containing protein [uncultured marine thaumarchaeote AD1000_01_A07]
MSLKAELHCHNVFSNGNVGALEPIYDCNVTISKQLEQAHAVGLDVLFVTNHNTIDGYKQMLEYKKNHQKFDTLNVYPAEEVTTNNESHVLIYGLNHSIKSGLSLHEVLDEAKKQDAVTVAPHPFSLLDALREDSTYCDLFEVFNSSNVDVYSNLKAKNFAKEKGLHVVVGSDSHVQSTIGRSTNLIHSENKLDSVIDAMKHHKITIEKTAYVQPKEALEHIRYKIENSAFFIDKYTAQFYPRALWPIKLLYKLYMIDPEGIFWNMFYRMSISALKKISRKINFEGYDHRLFRERNLVNILKMAL